MKKIYHLALVLIFFVATASAQHKLRIRAGGGVNFPTNHLNQNLNTGYDLTLIGTYALQKKIGIQIVTGYGSFEGKTTRTTFSNGELLEENGDLAIFRIGSGIEYKISPRLISELGAGFVVSRTGDSKYKRSSFTETGGDFVIRTVPSNNYTNGGSKFFASARLGYRLIDRIRFDLSYNYSNQVYGVTAINGKVSNLNHAGISVFYYINR